jgi:hypothetical protein
VTGRLSRRDALKILGATSASALFGSPNEDLGVAPGIEARIAILPLTSSDTAWTRTSSTSPADG